MNGGQIDPHPQKKTTLKNASLIRIKSKLLFEQICVQGPYSSGFIAEFEDLFADWESETPYL